MTDLAAQRPGYAPARPKPKILRNLSSKIASLPMLFVAIVVFIGCTLWSFMYSFTNAIALPPAIHLFPPDFSQYAAHFVGLREYSTLFSQDKWIVSVKNIFAYGVCALVGEFVIGFLLAVFIDQKIRFENGFRTIFLYPFALSFIVTGLVWAVDAQPGLRPAEDRCATSAGAELLLRLGRQPRHGDLLRW